MFTTFTPTFETQYGFSTGESGFVYLSLGVGIAISAFTIAQYSDKIMLAKAAKKNHDGRPEDRLILMIYGAPMVPIGLLWYGWSAQNKLQYMVPIVGIAFVGLGIMSVSVSIQRVIVYKPYINNVNSFLETSTWWTLSPTMLPLLWRL